MKKIIYSLFVLVFLMSCAANKPPKEKKQSTKDLLAQAYTFGFPLVLMDMTKELDTNVIEPDPQTGKAPLNQFVHHQVDPKKDLQLSTAWLDLSHGPVVLELPNTEGRFYFMPMLDAWTNVLMTPGKRTTGSDPRKFVIVGPKWEGDIPPGTEFIRSKTNLMWIVGRTQASNDKEREKIADIQKEYKLYPLEFLGRTFTPPEGIIYANLDMQPAVQKIFTLTGEDFFKRLNDLMKDNPPTGDDAIFMKKLAEINIAPGKDFNLKDFDKKDQAFITHLPMAMKDKFELERDRVLVDHVGWFTVRSMGAWGTDYSKRAVIAYVGFGTNQDEEAIYPFISRDVEGNKFTSSKRYILHFEADEVPDTNSFYSFATYKPDGYLFGEKETVGLISQDRRMKFNEDRSLDIYIQKESPGKDKESNWLPTPDGEFLVGAQLYLPKLETITDSWTLPPVFEAGSKVKISENLTEE